MRIGRRFVVLAVIVVAAVLVFATLRARQSACVSNEHGLRGEVTRGKDGQLLYFNGQCWTRQPVVSADTPF